MKRTRESSSSSGEEHRPQPKHAKHQHGSEEDHHRGSAEQQHRSHDQHQGGQGSSVPQAPMQDTTGGSRLYGDDVTYQPQNNPFAGQQDSAPRSHGSDAGRRNDPQPHAESSAQGAGRSQEQGGPATFPHLESQFPHSTHPVGGVNLDGIVWRGNTFDVDPIKLPDWTALQESQLRVITASFESWDEVESLGQPLPGQRNRRGMFSKIRGLKDYRRWTPAEDEEIKRMGAPPLSGWDDASKKFCAQHDRFMAEVYGRRKMFARGVGPKNLGTMPFTQKTPRY